MKVGIVGAGMVGATAAFALVMHGISEKHSAEVVRASSETRPGDRTDLTLSATRA